MLSAAHVLAMDAKHLLDVVDGIRMKHADVEDFISKRGPVVSSAVKSGSSLSGSPIHTVLKSS